MGGEAYTRLHLSLFNSLVDPEVKDYREVDIKGLVSLLTVPQRVTTDNKKYHSAWSPVHFRTGRRRDANVDSVSCLVLDYDSVRISTAVKPWADYFFVFHTTRSHNWSDPHFRIVLPMRSTASVGEHLALWHWANDRCEGTLDKACKDPGRAWLLPSINMWSQQSQNNFRGLASPGKLLDKSVAEDYVHHSVFIDRDRPRRLHLRDKEIADRRKLADILGGRIYGNSVRYIECMECGRPSVWYWLDPEYVDYAQCAHKGTCAWIGDLQELATGFRVRIKGDTR